VLKNYRCLGRVCRRQNLNSVLPFYHYNGATKNMNYGWNENSPDWHEDRKWILAEELEKALGYPVETKNKNYVNDGSSPYIEVDGAYGGVRIRRITHLSEEDHKKLVEEADRIFGLVMNLLIRE